MESEKEFICFGYDKDDLCVASHFDGDELQIGILLAFGNTETVSLPRKEVKLLATHINTVLAISTKARRKEIRRRERHSLMEKRKKLAWEERNAGKTLNEIGELLGCSGETVRCYIKSYEKRLLGAKNRENPLIAKLYEMNPP